MPAEKGPAFIRTPFDVRIPLVGVLDQAGAVTFLASVPVGFKAELEKVTYIPDVAGTGAGATASLDIRKGAAAGSIIVSVVPTLALHVLGGPGISANVSAANNELGKFNDADVFSITKAAGTVFTAAGGTLRLIFRQKLQARI